MRLLGRTGMEFEAVAMEKQARPLEAEIMRGHLRHRLNGRLKRVKPGDQSIFHILLELRDEMNIEGFQQLLEQRLRDVTRICDKFSKQAFAQSRNGLAVINVSGGNLTSQDFTTIIDDQMQFQAIKSAHRAFAACCKTFKNFVIVDAMVVTHFPSG